MHTADDYFLAGQRSTDWLAAQLKPDGSLAGAPVNFFCYYKLPIAFATAGRVTEAARALGYVEHSFFDENEFREGEVYRAATTSPAYRLAWFAFGAHAAGDWTLARRAIAYLLRGQDERTGAIGFRAGNGTDIDEYTVGTTCAAVLALATCGRIDEAIKGGRFIAGVFAEQAANAGALLLRRSADGKLHPPPASTAPVSWHVDLRAPGQIYWCLGYSLVCYARLFMLTADRIWLEHADVVHGWIHRCDPNVFANITSGKIAWGAALMYRASADERYAQLARRVGTWFLEIQTPEGAWVRIPRYKTLSEQPLAESAETTAERGFFMHEVAKALAVARG